MTDFLHLLDLASCLASGQGATVNEIIRKYEDVYTSRSSVYADFQNLGKHFDLLVSESDERRGVSNREVVHRIDSGSWDRFRRRFIQNVLSDDDRLLLSFMLESLGNLSPLVGAAGDDFISRLQSLIGAMTVKPIGSGSYFAMKNADNLLKLLQAQDKKRSLYIKYNGEKRLVWPLKCFMFSGGVYCFVMNKDGSRCYTISVPRIESMLKPLQVPDKKRPEPEIDIEPIFSDPFGIVREEEPFTAVVRIDWDQGCYEKEKAWPDSVSIVEDGDGWLFTVRTHGRYWLKRWVLSLGTAAEVIEPASLRAEIAGDVKAMAALYDAQPS